MSNFYVRGVLANLITLAIALACLFIPAGTFNYWRAWVFAAVFEVCAQALGIYFIRHDRKLVERRMNMGPVAEQRPSQKLISALFMLGFIGFVVFPAFDQRFGWSPVAPVVSVVADVMIVVSFLLFFVVMKSNSYAASTIQVEEGQPVVSTGPYAYVRHPMYSGALLLLAAMPLALGSWWGVLLLVPFFPVLVWRILDEEIFLRESLPGYDAYMRRGAMASGSSGVVVRRCQGSLHSACCSIDWVIVDRRSWDASSGAQQATRTPLDVLYRCPKLALPALCVGLCRLSIRTRFSLSMAFVAETVLQHAAVAFNPRTHNSLRRITAV